MLKVQNISKYYQQKQVLQSLDFTVEVGHAVGFVGPNGAGKSTTMNIITGYLEPTTGTVEIDGINQQQNLLAYKSKFGYLPEIPPLYVDMVVEDYLNFVFEAKKLSGKKHIEVERVMEKLEISHMRGRLIKHLSKGYKQRIGFAQAILGDPPVILLDEPTSGLDPGQIIEVRNLLLDLKKNHTILISSHILSEIQEVCDEILLIHEGKQIAYGTSEELISRYRACRRCEFVTRGKCNCVEQILVLSGIKSCQMIGEEQGYFRYLVEFKKDIDIRNELIGTLIRNQELLYEIKEIQDSLESAFLNLIKK